MLELIGLTFTVQLILFYRQSRNLRYNIKAHPKLYIQKPFPEVDTGPVYNFTFKEDQIPLFPVRTTDYGTNFYKSKVIF